MNKTEAFAMMIEGHKVTNRYFTSDEYLYYNTNNESIMTEDGYEFPNYWESGYLPDVEWTIYK